MSNRSVTSREYIVIFFLAAISLIVHIAFYVATQKSGGGSLGVDGEMYRTSALDCMASQTWLFEKCDNLFWTPWYVFIGLLRADPLNVFVFNLLMKMVATGSLLFLGAAFIRRGWLRLLPAIIWLFYWPTYNYTIFFHYEMFLAAVCSCLPLLVLYWVKTARSSESGIWPTAICVSSGVVLGLGIFAHARLVGAIAVFFVPLLLITQRPLRWRLIWGVAVVCLVGALPSLWWGYRNHQLFDKWVFSSTSLGYNLYVGYNEVATGYFMPQPPYPPLDQAKAMALQYMQENPGRSAGLFFKRLFLFWLPSKNVDYGPYGFVLQEYVVLLVAFVSYLLSVYYVIKMFVAHCRGRAISYLQISFVGAVIVIAWFQFFHAVFYVTNPRFRIPVYPLIGLLAVFMVDRLWRVGADQRDWLNTVNSDSPADDNRSKV